MIWRLNIEAENGPLARYADFLRSKSPTSRLGVSDAWSSPMVAHEAGPVRLMLTAVTNELSAALRKTVQVSRWQAWANINPPGKQVGRHTHSTARDGSIPQFCLVYFPADHPAALVFPDLDQRIQPQAGLAVVFPPDAAHYVEPNLSEQDRLSFAANAF